MRPPLTDDQKVAATASEDRVFIEAAPGSGKTTVATERYGVSRFGRFTNGKGVLALSFARAARGELDDRVRRRWGTNALRWPHKVWTLDHLHGAIVQHLLASGHLKWPAGYTHLEVLDSWRGHGGYRWCPAGTWRRAGVRVIQEEVLVGPSFQGDGEYAFSTLAQYRGHLEKGLCTHDEIRAVVTAAIANDSPVRNAIREFLVGTVSSLIVDEVFDGNELDLRLVALAANTGVPTTLIGDPWQALYGFRGAAPELVPELVAGLHFVAYPITESFRFETDEMRELADALRAGEQASVPAGAAADCDVVIATTWSRLWRCSDDVLPFSFGPAQNRLDAAIALLLDQVVIQTFDVASPFGADAAILLGLDPAAMRADGSACFGPVLSVLAAGTTAAAVQAVPLLIDRLKDLGSVPIPNLSQNNMATRFHRLAHIGRRLGRPSLVPGLTAHQAKGREWSIVGAALSNTEHQRLTNGLSQDDDDDRKLYVALTRARHVAALV